MQIDFLTLNKDDLLACYNGTRDDVRDQLAEYFVTINSRSPYEGEDVVEWFLDNHAFQEKDRRWTYVLL